MESYKSIESICGIIPPLFTPLAGQDDLDVPGLERLVEHIVDGGVAGLFVLGTTGGALSLSYRIRRELIERACRQVAGRVPVLVGITDTAVVESIALGEFAAGVGADALVVAAPPYYPAGQPEMIEYIDYLAERLPLPTFLYNMPSHTKIQFEPETVAAAMEKERIVGIKDSSGDMIYFNRLLSLLDRRPEFRILIGPEELLAESVLMGGHGGVCGGANLFPILFVRLYEAAAAGDLDKVRSLQSVVVTISSRLYRVGKHPSSLVKGFAAALSSLGICGGELALPYRKFGPSEAERVRAILDGLLPLIAQAQISG